MGKGDKRTRRGKIIGGSYGKTRAHTTKPPPPAPTHARPRAPKTK